MTKDKETFMDRVKKRHADEQDTQTEHSGQRVERLSLRERVARRKLAELEGETETPEKKKWRRRISLAGNFLQMIGLGLLVFELWPMLQGNFSEFDLRLIAIFATIFFVGRFIVAGSDLSKHLK